MGELESLEAVESMAGYRALRRLEIELEGLRPALTDALFEAIGGLEDKDVRTALLRLKRDVHNLRPFDVSRFEKVRETVRRKTARELERFNELIHHLGEARNLFETSFSAELVRIRRRFQDAVGTEDFRKGLLLASSTLFDELRRYARASPRAPGAKARQIERSLLRYYARAVVKTTPFSTFCAIVPGRFPTGGEPSPEPLGFAGDPRRKWSSIRLNKVVYPLLVQELKARPEVRRRLRVDLNPTLRRVDTRWSFLAEVDRQEVFQHLAPNPVLDLLCDLLTRRGSLLLEDLVEGLLENVDASQEQMAAYADRLLDAGFLRFRLGIREQDVDWDRRLRRLLEGPDDEHARRTVAFLREYRRGAETYATAPIEQRRGLLTSLSALADSHFESLEGKDWAAGTSVLFEDAGSHTSLALDLGDLGELAAEYVRLTLPFIWIVGEQVNMRHFFGSHYGSRSVALLRFYEDYYREHFKDHLAAVREAEEGGDKTAAEQLANPFGLELVAQLNHARRRFEQRIRELWQAAPEAEEIVLERHDLEAAAEGLSPEEPCRSVSLFVQHVPNLVAQGEDGLVLSEYLAGFGKYFSRFLHLLPDEVTQDLRASNRRLTGAELAEVCGEASFNADLHPPLLGAEIAYPTAEGGAAEEQVPVSNLVVEPDPHRPLRVRLRDTATGREVVPVDLGFLSPRLRPPLFQLLSRMTPATAFLPNLPEEPENGSREQVIYRPRVTYRGRLVLARRRWTLPRSLFPGRRRKEAEADYFLRVQRWREQLALPEEVFVRVLHKAPSRPSARKPREHLDKPQYVDFRHPLLVDLFSRMGENLDDFRVVLEERLPGRDQLVAWGEERFVTELVVQVDFPSRETE